MAHPDVSRRKALGLLGASTVGAVMFAACGGSGKDEASPSSDSPASTTAGAGSSTTDLVAPPSLQQVQGRSILHGHAFADGGPLLPRCGHAEQRPPRGPGGGAAAPGRSRDEADGCTPIKDAVFEIWHCDAVGNYSGFEAASRGAVGPGGPRGPGGGSAATDSRRYLRGAQLTNGDGIAEITTIYPGWYRGRTVHIHAKVLLSNKEVLTTQLYFGDELTRVSSPGRPTASTPGAPPATPTTHSSPTRRS